jgi:4,5-DOPA dioxygenase extradiol
MSARSTDLMPVLFVGHGSPMNAIEENRFHVAWRRIAERIPRPQSIVCVSAHWESNGVLVTSSTQPETIHDFTGFPTELARFRYPAHGDPHLAERITEIVKHARVRMDPRRGLDHGAWGVLCAMYPDADVPVVQLSLDATESAAFHYRLAKDLAPLRTRGVLILASGNIVHNLRRFEFERQEAQDWALRFTEAVKQRIASFDHTDLVAYEKLGRDAQLSVPSPEHYWPLLYALAQQSRADTVEFFNDEVVSSISMTSVLIGSS